MSALKYYDTTSGTWKYLAQGIKGNDGIGVPSGGTVGKVLVKKSGDNYDTEWRDLSVVSAKLKALSELTAINSIPAVPAVMASPPTISINATTDSSLTKSFAYNSTSLTLRGCVPYAKETPTSSGYTYYQNTVAGGTPESPFLVGNGYWIEFDHYGQTLELVLYMASAGKIWSLVDGAPTTQYAIQPTSLTGRMFYKMAFASVGFRRIRIFVQNRVLFGGINVGPNDSVSPAEQKTFKIAILGDSWTEGYSWSPITSAITGTGWTTGLPASEVNYVWQLGEMLNAEIFSCGQAGTGYYADGTAGNSEVFNGTNRINAIKSIDGGNGPDLIMVFGSLNDDASLAGNGVSGHQVLATALYNNLKTNLPNTKLIVAGPQSTSGSPSQNRLDNDTAVGNAALVASNVIGYIDLIVTGEHWIYGGGDVSSGTGNNTIFMQSNSSTPAGTSNHLTDAGHKYYARRFFKEIVRLIKKYTDTVE